MTKEELLQLIATNLTAAVQKCQQSDVGLSVLRELAANDLETPGVELFLASVQTTPSRVLETLAQRDNPEVLRILVQNPNLHGKLASHPNPAVRRMVAENRRLTPVIAQQLSRDPVPEVRVSLAKNPLIPTNIQRTLLQDPVPFVRLALLENRKLDAEFLDGLSDDMNPTVHACTLLAPRLSPTLMHSWAEFDEELCQLALSQRNDLPPPIVAILAKSHFPYVRLSTLRHQAVPLASLTEFAASDNPEALAILTTRETLPPDLQKVLLANPALPEESRLKLAQRTDLDDEVALELCRAPSPAILQALALNLTPGLTRTRTHLTEIGDSYLLKTLLANPFAHESEILSSFILNATEDALCHLAFRAIPCNAVSPEAKTRLANSPLPSVRRLVEGNAISK